MALSLRSGLAASAGLKSESTYGTGVTVDTFVPLVSESIECEIDRLESAGIVAGQLIGQSTQWAAGNVTVSGDLQLELYQQNAGVLLHHMLGFATSTGSAPGTHTITPGSLAGKSFTLQLGRPDTAGTVNPFTYTGCKITSWEMAASVGEIVTLGLSVVAQQEGTATALAAASYNADLAPFVFTHASVNFFGTAFSARQFTLSGDNGLNVDRRFLGGGTIEEPLDSALRAYTGNLQGDFTGLVTSHYDRFKSGAEGSLIATITTGASEKLTITTNIRLDGSTPNIEGPDVLAHEIPFKCVATSSVASTALSILLTNGQSTVA